MWFCDITIMPLARTWPADLALCLCTLVFASQINIMRILEEVEGSAYVSFQCLAFISGLTCHHKVCWA